MMIFTPLHLSVNISNCDCFILIKLGLKNRRYEVVFKLLAISCFVPSELNGVGDLVTGNIIYLVTSSTLYPLGAGVFRKGLC